MKGRDIREGDLRKHGGLDDGNEGRGKGSMTDWGRVLDQEGKEGGRGGGVSLSGKRRRRRRKGGEGNHRSRTQGRRVTRDKVVG